MQNKFFAATLISTLISIVFLVAGCNYNELKTQPRSPSAAGGVGSPEASIDFATVKAKVFDSVCIKCHGPQVAKDGLRLDQYTSTFERVDDIRNAVESGDMPPPPPRGATLSEEQKAMLFAWLDSGAPETVAISQPPAKNPDADSGTTDPEPPQTPTPVAPPVTGASPENRPPLNLISNVNNF